MRHHERDDHKKTVETAAERIHDRELLGGHRQLEGLRRHHDNRVAHAVRILVGSHSVRLFEQKLLQHRNRQKLAVSVGGV